MTAATDSTDGTLGTVPAPERGQQNNFLRGDGTWAPVTDTWIANSTNTAGYVSAPSSSNPNKVWKTDANGEPGWRDEEKTSYSMLGGDKVGIEGLLVPPPALNQQNNNNFLKGDGTWETLNGRFLTEAEYNNLSDQHLLSRGYIEILPISSAKYGGYIDFNHPSNSDKSKGYSSRIVEWDPGLITLNPSIRVLENTKTKTLEVENSANINSANIEGNLTVRKALGVSGSAIVRGAFTVDNGLHVTGGADITGTSVAINGILKTQRADNKENGHTVVVSSNSATGGVFMLNSYQKNSLAISGNWGEKSGTSTRYAAVTTTSDKRLK